MSKTELFIKNAIKIYEDKYDYSKVEYLNIDSKVIIICKIHGEFEQSPYHHIHRKQGCRKCGITKRSLSQKMTNAKNFIEKATKIHGDKYDYSKVEYIKSREKIIIICKEHGEFLQRANGHLNKKGCIKCTSIVKSNTEEFIQRAILIHDNKYDYSKVKYNSRHKKVIIICNIHGEFLQEVGSHLSGNGCKFCGILDVKNKQTKSILSFINEANIKHNNKYDYSSVKYINCKTKIIIICKEHGYFIQEPKSHLLGCGCPKCATNKQYSKSQIKWLEFLEIYYNINIQHMGNSNQEYKIKNTKWKADGYCKETNTIFEYHGSFWHGDPKIYKPDDMNNVSKRTMGTLYKRTINREQKIKELGYNLEVMWESDWNNINKSISILQKKFKTCKDLNLLI
jgi:G:T-mismatch repair DNA endonuclease (very short patch repair protein)